MTRSSVDRLRAALVQPVSVRPLVWFRVAFGLLMVWEVTRYFRHGWIERYYVEPRFHFNYYGFGWVTPWPGWGMRAHFAVLGLLALGLAAGAFYRVTSALFFLGFTYVFLLDQARYLNHFYLIVLLSLLLIFVPAHRDSSFDAWRRQSLRSRLAPAWALWLLRFQVAVPYFFGGLAKLDGDWLRGEPMRMWLHDRRDLVILGPFGGEPWLPYVFSFGGLFIDVLAVPFLLWRRTVYFAFAMLAVFHLLNAMIFRIGVFPWLMLAATVILFWPRWGLQASDQAATAPRLGRGPLVLLGAYVAFQVLMPLRHLLYPGDADWTEEGHRFSWHMKLRDKESRVRFRVTDVASSVSWEIDPRDYLSKRQVREMSGRPDMILQFAHHVRADLQRQGLPRVEVRAEVRTSLNGRQPQLLIDPNVDLAARPRTLWPALWILPLTEPLPSRPRGGSGAPDPSEADEGS